MGTLTEDQKIAWCAGLFDGEGCISISLKGKKKVLLTLGMTDEDVVQRFQVWLGHGYVCGPYAPHVTDKVQGKKQFWRWSCQSKTAIVAALMKMLPYFGQRRTDRANEALGVLETIQGWDEAQAKRGLPRGVQRRGNRYRAQGYVNGKFTNFGSYLTPEEARLAVVSKEIKKAC